MPQLRIVTTSWDDGEKYDLRLAEMLRARNIAATFYVPLTPYLGRPSLSHADLRTLDAEGFEIGAHGLSHKHLWKLPAEELHTEIDPCKPTLEEILGCEIRMFCYPRGRYDRNVIRVLREAGYLGARTVKMLATDCAFDPFEMPTTVQVAPHRPSAYFRNVARAGDVHRLQVCLTHLAKLGDWFELSKKLFDSVIRDGGVWHLYGHSHEIEELGLWSGLGALLDHVCNRRDVMYLPNWRVVSTSLGCQRLG
jgi:peptidoglycan-N-acetylglucosamine deacetylase